MENKSRLLMKEQPLVVDKELAKLIGLNEAIVLQQIEYWTNIKEISDIKKNKTRNENFVDGYYWTYNSIEDWTKEFPFWSNDTVKRTLKKLREKNLVVVDNFNLKGYDRTLWYRVNHEELINLENAIGANCPNEENSDLENEKTLEPLKTDISAKCPNGLVQNAPMHKCNMPQPIPKTSTKISTKTGSSSRDDFSEVFENNICELKETTKIKFKEYCDTCDFDLINAAIEYSAEINIKSFAGFKTIIDSAIEKGIITADAFKKDIESYRADKKKKSRSSNNKPKKSSTSNSKELRFNNFEGREYDYDSLEKKLLGWE